ncbi:CCR4-NOT transcription complex subunit 3 isoform X2 [Zerene cesonia]|uniref:CCR4-NOT transcription complex subunit 3 isoform X2 n=1 Tax=Zerene cesonia TaxID=33412 RepID=UPI0018E4FF82|nr:CCR4-NOT transcription complex subunit 3 isoform X2 [Zerene cesonia]
MAATRKLQGEIDRCLKKVTEGVETFEDIWQKVHNATNSNQKEKYEADLKKEIKKLQRLRDQIKSWIASGEIKDKSTLLEYRKLIETQMERFKVVERETKTKAYSKEGLGAAQKLDPAQKEREEMSSWLISSIDALNLQIDLFESEVESLLVGKKKRLDKEKQDRMEELKLKLERHRYHIKKLETLLRMLDNMSVEVEQKSITFQIKNIREDVEYYIMSSLEPGYEENEYIYEDINGLDEIELSGVGVPSSATTDSNNSNDSPGSPTSMLSGTSPPTSPALDLHNHTSDSVDITDKKKKDDVSKPVKPLPLRAVSCGAAASPANLTALNHSATNNSINNSTGASGTSTPIKPPAPSSPHQRPNNTEVLENGPVSNTPVHTATHLPPPTLPAPTSKSSSATTLSSAIANPNPNQNASTNPSVNASVNANANASANTSLNTSVSVSLNASARSVTPSPPSPLAVNGPVHNAHHTPQHMLNLNNGRVSEPPSTPAPSAAGGAGAGAAGAGAGGAAGAGAGAGAGGPERPTTASLKSMAQEAVHRAGLDAHHTQNTRRGVPLSQAHIPPLLGVAPLGPLPLNSEHQVQFQMMEAAFYHMPHPSDSERTRVYLPRNICQTPAYYNQVLLPHSDTVEFFQRLSTETLFFVFYYMEGTKAQYLAAKALKKQSWRFHTKYMMWFQRHEEPKVINEEYEQGTYIYFDYEKWGQRKKEGFTFEYKYLEDRDLN